MLMLRLARAGSKKRPVYHLVAADRRARRDGRFIENLGYYIPARDILVLKQDRIDHWLAVGAQQTDTAKALIKKAKRDGNKEPVAKARPTLPPPVQKPVKAEEPKAKAGGKGSGPKGGGKGAGPKGGAKGSAKPETKAESTSAKPVGKQSESGTPPADA